MNAKYIINRISNYLLICTLLFTVFACKDDENADDNSNPILLSSNIEDGAIVSASGYIELTFSKNVRQAPNTVITLNGTAIRIIILDNVVRYKYQFPDETDCIFDIPDGALTDMSGKPCEGISLNFKILEEEVSQREFDAIVDPSGKGNYTTIQAAVNAAPNSRTTPYLIFVANGTYEEFVNIPKTKPFIHLIGQDKEKTIVTYMLTSASDASGDGGEEAWAHSWRNPINTGSGIGWQEAVTMVFGTDFYAENISFENRWGIEKLIGPMAEAMYTANDRIAFYNCKFRSFQDTWQTKVQTSSADNGINARHYATDCWIEGAVDYFYGSGNVLIENTLLYNLRYGSVITAGAHAEGTKWGYVFNNCTVDGINKVDPDKYGTTSLAYQPGKGVGQTLGRPWQNAPVTVFLNTQLKFDIDPAGWRDMGVVPALYAEYNTTKDGKAVDMTQRKTSYLVNNIATPYLGKTELNYLEASKYTYDNIIKGGDGWNPKKFAEKIAAPDHIALNGTTLSWDARYKAICYLIFKTDGEFVAQTTETSLEVDDADATYVVKSVNKYGSVGN